MVDVAAARDTVGGSAWMPGSHASAVAGDSGGLWSAGGGV